MVDPEATPQLMLEARVRVEGVDSLGHLNLFEPGDTILETVTETDTERAIIKKIEGDYVKLLFPLYPLSKQMDKTWTSHALTKPDFFRAAYDRTQPAVRRLHSLTESDGR